MGACTGKEAKAPQQKAKPYARTATARLSRGLHVLRLSPANVYSSLKVLIIGQASTLASADPRSPFQRICVAFVGLSHHLSPPTHHCCSRCRKNLSVKALLRAFALAAAVQRVLTPVFLRMPNSLPRKIPRFKTMEYVSRFTKFATVVLARHWTHLSLEIEAR